MRIYVKHPQLSDPDFVENYNFHDCATRRQLDHPPIELDVAVAILKTGGVACDMASLLGRSRTVVHTFVWNSPELTDLMDEVAQTTLDKVEAMQMSLALAGDGAAGRFILSTLGKDRGYTTKTLTDVRDVTKVEINGKDAEL
jgi:hypothetical protein